MGSPPLARGTLATLRHTSLYLGITPACAGHTMGLLQDTCACRDHPRLRGAHLKHRRNIYTHAGSPPLARGTLLVYTHCLFLMGSPPLARGTHFIIVIVNFITGITPACAGHTADNKTAVGFCQDHPRLRGAHGSESIKENFSPGSPPLARGTQPLFLRHV